MQAITIKKEKSGKKMISRNQKSEKTIMTLSEKNSDLAGQQQQRTAKDYDSNKGSTEKVRELHKTMTNRQPVANTSTGQTTASNYDDISSSSKIVANTINSTTTTKSSSSSSSYMSQKQNSEFSSEQVLSSVDLLDIETKKPMISSVPIDVIDIQHSAGAVGGISGTTITKKSSSTMAQTEKLSEMMTTSSSAFYEQESLSKQSHAEIVTKTITDSAAMTSSSSSTSTKMPLSKRQFAADSAISSSTNDNDNDNHNKYKYVEMGKNAAPALNKTTSEINEYERLSQRTTNVGAASNTTTTTATNTKSSHETIQKQHENQQKTTINTTTKKLNAAAANNDSKTIKNAEKKTKTQERKNIKQSVEENSTKTEFYDAKTKTWSTYNEQALSNIQKPTIVRYFSTEPNGNNRIIYKKKVYDQRNNKWKVVDEKIVDSNSTDAVYPEIIDDVINTTKTTYTTKLYNTKLGKWEVVDEKSYVDSQAYIPHDIACEIEKDNTDIANITTTSEVTKVINNYYNIHTYKIHEFNLRLKAQ